MLAACLALVLSGCAARFGDRFAGSVLAHQDYQLVADGLPSFLLTLDGLIANFPKREALLRSGASLYSAYAGAFVDEPERAAYLAEHGFNYALRAVCRFDDKLCDVRTMPLEALEKRLAKHDDEDDLPTLFALGSAWITFIQAHSSDWAVVGELGRVQLLMEHVVAVDESYQQGQAHVYLGALNTLLPEALGGNPEQGRYHFEQAVRLSQGRNLMAKTLYAERYARLVFDQELHDRLLAEVLAAEVAAEEFTLSNVLAVRQAQQLKSTSADYFE